MQKLCRLLQAGPKAEATHRALLALRILTDREGDRVAIMRAGAPSPYTLLLLLPSLQSFRVGCVQGWA